MLVPNKHLIPTTQADTEGKEKERDKIEAKQWIARTNNELEVKRVRAQIG